MRSFGKAACPISLGRLKKEQVPFPRIIFEYKEMEATSFRFLYKLIIHIIADAFSRVVSCELLPQMIYVTIEESGDVLISNKLASRYYFRKIAVPYREFFTKLDRFLLFGDGKKLANILGRRRVKSLEKVVNCAIDNVFHDIFGANIEDGRTVRRCPLRLVSDLFCSSCQDLYFDI